MPTIQDLTIKYQNYSDEELFEVYSKIDEYSIEAKEALKNVLDSNGGIDGLKERINKATEINTEISRIESEIANLYGQETNKETIKKRINFSLISQSQFENIFKETIQNIEHEIVDRKIKPRTILGSIFGGFIGGSIGGLIWGLQLIYSGHIFWFLIVVLFMLSFAFIRLFTNQKRNIIVIIMTIISVIYAIILGHRIYDFIGYIE